MIELTEEYLEEMYWKLNIQSDDLYDCQDEWDDYIFFFSHVL